MERHVINLVAVVSVAAALTLSGCGGGSDSNAVSNSPPSIAQTVTVAGTVTLPSGSAAKASDLVMQTNTNSSTISTNGTFSTNGVSADTTGSTLAIVTTKSGNPVFLKQVQADGSNSSSPVDAKSTAEALVLYDPVFLRMSAVNQQTARNNMAIHTRYTELVTLIENSVKTDSVDPLSATTHKDIYDLAVLISKDLLAKFPQSKVVGKMDTGNFVGVTDDENQNLPSVLLVNNSYTYYEATIKKSGTVVNNSQGSSTWRVGRKNLVTVAFEWPPVSINQAVTSEVSLGDGDFTFDFNKQSGLSVFDGMMTLASTIIGVKSDSIETLDIGYKVLISTGSKVAILINKMITQKPNTKDEAETMFYNLMVSNTGLTDLLDFAKTYFAAKITAMFNDSWFTASARLVASKMVVWGTGAYGGAELAAITLSVAQAPDTYSEVGTQSNGKYPAVTITALNPAQGAENSSVNITGSGFGTIKGLVKFNGTLATITSWSENQISVTVPYGATTGSVVVYAGSVASNNMPFTVSATGNTGTGGGTGAKFTNNGNGTITQNLSKDLVALNTKLMWQQVDDGKLRTWDDAKLYCEGLSLGGYSGWMLPTLSRLTGIVDTTKSPKIDTAYFTNAKAAIYWTGTVSSDGYTAAYIDFTDGSSSYITKNSYDQLVRCVRAMP